MNLSELIPDPYNRRARLQPALLALLPIALVCIILYPNIEAQSATPLAILVHFGGAAWLIQISRDRGKKLQPDLYAKWGGKPSVALLRHRDRILSPQTKARYHAFLRNKVPYFVPPSPETEQADSKAADAAYESATDWLLEKTRDTKKYRMIFEENMNYGFRRNYWALKPVVLLIDLTLIIAIFTLHFSSGGALRVTKLPDPPIALALLIATLHLCLTLFLVTKSWVRTPATEYAQQLLAACDGLATD